MAHCIPVSVRPSSRWMFGAAIETIVWSMNVIATAKIIPARIRFLGRPVALIAVIATPWLARRGPPPTPHATIDG